MKKRSDEEKTQLKSYDYELTKIDKNIIQEVLKKCPDLKKKAKTVAERKSASRSDQNEEKKEVEREKAKQGMTEIRSMEDAETREKRLHDMSVHNKNKCSMEDPETGEKRRKQHRKHMSQIHSMENAETREKRLDDTNVYNKNKRSMEDPETGEKRKAEDKQRTRKIRAKPSKNWTNELIDKSSLIYICTSECRYRPKGSVVLVFA